MVDVELTADPILSIIAKMAADAIADIQVKAAATGTANIRDFDWAGIAKKSITAAESEAKKQLLSYVEPFAAEAFERVKAANEAESGTEVLMPEADHDLVRIERLVETVAREAFAAIPEESGEGAQDAEMVDADDEGHVSSSDGRASMEPSNGKDRGLATSANGAAIDDDEDWTGKCFCGEADIFGDMMFECAAGKSCRHQWYHEDCIKAVVKKADVPDATSDSDWWCPYCGGYRVKASMNRATMLKKPEFVGKLVAMGIPLNK
jgi:hypothetical protein